MVNLQVCRVLDPPIKRKISVTCLVTEIYANFGRDDKNIRQRLLILY